MRFAVLTLSALFTLVSFAETPAQPGLTKDSVNKTVSSHAVEIKDCYLAAQKKKVNPRGTLDVKFTIQKDGSATGIKVLDTSTLYNGKVLQDCLLKKLPTWHFAKASAPTEVPDFPFSFTPIQ